MSERHTHDNYSELNEGHPPLTRGEDVWVWDTEGNKFLDFLSGYSANNFGHRHPAIIKALVDQADKLTLTARAFGQDKLEPFSKALSELTGKDRIIPMNTGAEAVETAIKLARKWGYEKKGITKGKANIIVMDGNFHGRTTTIISFSSDPTARDGFDPYTSGFTSVPYGDIEAIAGAIDKNTAAVLFEPIQGESGVIVPPEGFLKDLRELCTKHDVLMMADEIQSGLGRTGDTFACDHENVKPDVYILGKALGGGVLPVSAVAANKDIMTAIKPGEHGSTFGGNPLACAVGYAAIELLKTGKFQKAARENGLYLHEQLNTLIGHGVKAVRGRGLWAGIDIDPALMSGHDAAEKLYEKGILAKDTHGSTIRFSPPLTISKKDIAYGVERLRELLSEAGA